MSAKILFWSLCAFLFFGAVAFLACIVCIVRRWRRERREAIRFAMDPVRRFRP